MTSPVSRLRVAILLETPSSTGGGYSQTISLAREMVDWKNDGLEFVLVVLGASMPDEVEALGMPVEQLRDSRFSRLTDRFAGMSLWLSAVFSKIRAMVCVDIGRSLDAKLSRLGIDLVLFPGPSSNMVRLCDVNFIATIWDVCHRDHPEFPEVRKAREFERREALYFTALPRAVAVIVDSDQLSARLTQFYGLDSDRMVVLPFKPSLALRQAMDGGRVASNPEWAFSEPYLFYPAQFWAHKNHAYILDALRILSDEFGVKVSAVFCGKDQGNLDLIRERVRQLGLDAQVYFLGFVSTEELVHLYSHALTLVMPTYFGPTNIPPLEAFATGCPVVVSDLPSFRDAYGDAAIYCDLADPLSLAMSVKRLIDSPDLRGELVSRSTKIAQQIEKIDYRERLAPVFAAFQRKIRSFKKA